MKTLPSQEYLQSRIDYNPETGEARWKEVDESYGTSWSRFNKLFANKLLKKKAVLDGIGYSTGQLIYKLVHNKDVIKLIYLDKDSNNLRISNLTDSLSRNISVKYEKAYLYKNIPPNCVNLLTYNHQTGIFTWLPRDNNHFNATYAGKEAGYLDPKEYRMLLVDGSAYGAHRIAWFMYYDVDPGTYQIDHIDGNRSNNAIKNLRLANSSFNVSVASKNAKGYSKTRSGKFNATVRIANKAIHLGTFDTESEARDAYQTALAKFKPIYEYTLEEQSILDELYQKFPNVTKDLQHRAHEIQVKALEFYINATKN